MNELPASLDAKLRELAPNLATLAEILRENGYATGGFTGNAGVSGGFGYDQGFDVYEHEQGKFGSFDQSIPKALAWLKTNKDRKFFLFLHGYDAHGQNTPAAGFDYRFVDKKYDKKYTGDVREQESLREQGLSRGSLDMREADVKFWRAVYDEKIQRADEKLQHFLPVALVVLGDCAILDVAPRGFAQRLHIGELGLVVGIRDRAGQPDSGVA